MAGFGVQPQNIVIDVGFSRFARFLHPPNVQFPKKKFFPSTLMDAMYFFGSANSLTLNTVCMKNHSSQ